MRACVRACVRVCVCVCVFVVVVVVVVVVISIFFISLTHRQPHAVFRGFITISEAWMLLYKELIIAEGSPRITMQRVTTFECSLGSLLGVEVLWHSPSQGRSETQMTKGEDDRLNRA